MKETKQPLETRVCTRCGGTGQYSYCSMYGSTCFKCGGAGHLFTARGQAANDYLRAIRSVPVEQLALGMTVRVELMAMSGASALVWRKVSKLERVTEENASYWHVQPDGSRKVGCLGGFHVECTAEGKTTISKTVEPGTPFRVAQTAEQKAATLAQALAYQATLNKDGTPKKRA